MKFEAMLGFWKIKNMIKHSSCISNNKMYDTQTNHIIYFITVVSVSVHANIMYRYEQTRGEKSNIALIYADILFNGFPDATGRGSSIFLKNVRCYDLCKHLIEDI